jgi:predicted transcriptional regulator
MKQRSEFFGMIYKRGYSSRRQFAKQHGFPESYISLIGTGRLNPDISLIKNISKALKCRPEEIFTNEDLSNAGV